MSLTVCFGRLLMMMVNCVLFDVVCMSWLFQCLIPLSDDDSLFLFFCLHVFDCFILWRLLMMLIIGFSVDYVRMPLMFHFWLLLMMMNMFFVCFSLHVFDYLSVCITIDRLHVLCFILCACLWSFSS